MLKCCRDIIDLVDFTLFLYLHKYLKQTVS